MKKDTGIFQLKNGNYGYRIVINRKDLKIDTTYHNDENGNPFKTKASARDARERKIYELKNNKEEINNKKIKKYTLEDIYNLYMENGSTNKAHATIKKQKSMWENHIKNNFGNKYIEDIKLNDLQNYLNQLYLYGDDYNNGSYTYKYVEGFLKFFYLLFGYAYKENAINTDNYTKMFLDRSTKLNMPKITQEDKENYDNLKVYNKYEIKKISEIFKRGNCYLSFLLGYYCGLRISEVFALTIDDIDFENMTLKINKQLLYQDGVWCLCPVKTLNSVRIIDLPQNEDLIKILTNIYAIYNIKDKDNKIKSEKDEYRNYEIIIDKTKKEHKKIQGLNFINRKENGELLTPNSIKYWSKIIKEELNIDFKFHSLRKTHATMMAGLNTPVIELMNRLGHKKIDTTLKYYINDNKISRDILKENLYKLEYKDEEKPKTKSEIKLEEIIKKINVQNTVETKKK